MRRKIGALGAILLGIGVFLPALKAVLGRIQESFSFIRIFPLWGILLLGLAIWAFAVSLSGGRKAVLLPGFLSLFPIVISALDFSKGYNYVASTFKMLNEFSSSHLLKVKVIGWSWFFLITGEILLLISGFAKEE